MPKQSDVTRNFLDRIEGFVAAFNQVSREGFFAALNANIDWRKGASNTIKISATGYIPDDSKDMEDGVTSFIEPETVLVSIRDKLYEEGFSLTCTKCEVSTSDWPKLDKAGEKVIGKKGLEIQFDLILYLQPKKWAKKK